MNPHFSPKNPKPNLLDVQNERNISQNNKLPITSYQLPICETNPIKANSKPIFPSSVFCLPSSVILCLWLIFFNISCSKKPANAVSAANEKAESNQQAQEPNDPNEKKPPRPEHKHPAFTERIEERGEMVAAQIKARDVNDPNVLKAMQTVPRHSFVEHPDKNIWNSNLKNAYADYPLPIGFNQTISQPYIVAFMTEALQIKPDDKVLEIGTGSGYQAAVCAEIAREVYTIEIVEPLAQRAEKLLKELGYRNVFVKAGDGYFGWPNKAPFDAIIGTAAAERIPEPLIEQLRPGGRMILPYETEFGFQYLVLITRDENGELHKKNVMPVRFVPMTGEVQKKKK